MPAAVQHVKAVKALLPCPFCGSDKIGYRAALGRAKGAFFCNNCECRAPREPDKYRAMAAWNRRAPSVAESIKDAQRYRWLRSEHEIRDGQPFIARQCGARFSRWTEHHADAAIDIAMQAKK